VNQREWETLYRERSQWRRIFGAGTPVCVAAADPESEQLYNLVNRLADHESAYVLIQGGRGTGKSMCIAAADAALSDADIYHVVLDPRQSDMVSSLLGSLGRTDTSPVVLVDDCGGFESISKRLVQRRSSLAGFIISAVEVGSDLTQQLTGATDAYIRLPHIQYRVPTLLLMASLMWEELVGFDSNISAACDDSAVAALLRGPFEDGAWSLNEVLRLLLAQLVSTADLVEGHIRRPITGADITSAVIQYIAARFSPALPEPRATQVILEGDTDVMYLRHAAHVAQSVRNWDLVNGLEFRAAAPGRGGGGEAVTARLIGLRDGGIPAIGIFDNDAPGRRAAKLARDRSLSCLLLPKGLDPLRRRDDLVAVEIEDLLPVDLMMRSYEEHLEIIPEERHWCNGYWRLVPAGRDKETLAQWIGSVATLDDMEAFLYLLCAVRSQVGLPIPSDALSLTEWEQSIRARQPDDPTVGLPFRIPLSQ
jgi:hypothetical protein